MIDRLAFLFFGLTRIFAIFVILSLVSPAPAQAERIIILTEEWPPYNYTESSVLRGFSVEIVQQIIRQLKANADIQIYPSARAIKILRNNPDTMFISMFRSPNREHEFQWIGPLIDSSIFFYKRKNDPQVISTLEDAKKVRLIASRQSGTVFNILKSNNFTNLDDTAKDGHEVYKKLLAGRCDLGISDSPLGVKYILRKIGQPSDALVQTPVKILNMQLYIAANNAIPTEVIMRWQHALDELKANGLYDQILKKYID